MKFSISNPNIESEIVKTEAIDQAKAKITIENENDIMA
jgi:hypothetical protein